jgi:hypothetical protein
MSMTAPKSVDNNIKIVFSKTEDGGQESVSVLWPNQQFIKNSYDPEEFVEIISVEVDETNRSLIAILETMDKHLETANANETDISTIIGKIALAIREKTLSQQK